MRTRVKICGLRSNEDIHMVADAGADAIGLVVYAGSKRAVTIPQAARLRREIPVFISAVVLLVNASQAEIEQIINDVKPSLLQFHGDESAEFCEQFRFPYIRALRVGGGALLSPDAVAQEVQKYPNASGFLFDAYSAGYGGSGLTFDLSLLDKAREILPARKIIIAGGLNASNVQQLIRDVKPYAIDLSSGVESAPGVKSAEKTRAFMQQVANA
ncbi:phosphoribosylanthranilate isomerase [Advenella alkanexedens]|uniref:phosphoribosylanthranilate isomerase n=1 Tax=Advenella alkanexedens TaxID=1481665 RepID=UPI000AFCD800|nr:phosphoribosylanthranilate isomerase [Advenella alkanexedens]NLY34692.1 phosphoribosylanthranilate isomerase [Alcaligenaceae bacterium]WKU18262.1 phosphoribosylanthranilate isomerase [Advenella alkanexedens]